MVQRGAPPPQRQSRSLEDLNTPDFSIQYWSEVADSLLWLFELTRVNQDFIENMHGSDSFRDYRFP